MRFRTTTLALTVIATSSLVMACSVPVFRYALEHWRPDAYIAYVFYSGELTPEEQLIVESLEPKGLDGLRTANLLVRAVNVLEDSTVEIQKILEEHPTESYPWVVVQTPPKVGPPQTVWQGELNSSNVALVMDSPARKLINQKLTHQESVVWVFLESGRKEIDDLAFQILTTQIELLERTLKLPEIEEADLEDLSVDPAALKISFSAIRISRDDPKEQVLTEMLLRVEPDLKDPQYMDEPMVFPVFGRGRALYAILGQGIVPKVIEETGHFLTGACQCTVKSQNPGVDLIMNLDWDQHVVPIESIDEELPPLAGFSGFGLSDEEISLKNDAASINVKNRAENTDITISDTRIEQQPIESIKREVNRDSSETSTSSNLSIGFNVWMILGLITIGVMVASKFLAPRAS